MATLLKVAAMLWLVIVWGCFGFVSIVGGVMMPELQTAFGGFALGIYILAALLASVPAAFLYGFAQVIDYTAETAEHLRAMRRYYEPSDPDFR